MLDDIGDWQHDLKVGHNTYFLAQITDGSRRDLDEVEIDRVQSRVDDAWADVEHLRLVIEWLDESITAVGGIDCPGWIEYVEGYKTLADEHLTTAIARHLVRKLKPLMDGQLPD